MFKIFSFTVLLAATSMAAAGADNAELLNKAAAALDDELYDFAEQTLRQYPHLSADANQPATEYVILLAQTLHGQKRYAEMLALLDQNRQQAQNTPLADKFAFWLARAYYANGRLTETLEQTAALEGRYPDSTATADIIRLRAGTLLKLGRQAEAIGILEKLVKGREESPASANDRLALGRILADAGRTQAACVVLEKLLSYPPESSIGQKSRSVLARVYINEKQLKKAGSIYETLFAQKNIPAEYRLQAVEALADIAAAQTNYAAALAWLDNGQERLQDPFQKNRLALRKGLLFLKMNKIDDGITLIHNYVSAQTNSTAAARVQLELAQTLLDLRLDEKALAEFQNCLETFNSPPDLLEAHKGKGAALFNLGRHHEAAAAFAKAEELSNTPEEKNQCRFRRADALFAAGQPDKAAEIYAQIADTADDLQLGRRALFQTAECLLQSGKTAEAAEVLWKIYDDDPDDALGPRALLRLADVFLRRNELSPAVTIYRWVNQDYGGQMQARSIYGLGLAAYRAGRYAEALNYFEQALAASGGKLAGEEEIAADAAYMRGWSLFMLNKIEEARRCFAMLFSADGGNTCGRSAKAPEALFWLGDLDYNLRRYDSAENSFRLLADKYPAAPKADEALFWAGRAALNQNEFKRGRDYFSALIKRYPASRRRPDARYFQGVALCELGQFDAAILIFNEIIKQYPDHQLTEAAAFKKADCLFVLGSDEPKRYEEALNAYQVILDQPQRPLAVRLQAKYKLGRCLEKLGKANEAFAQYVQVVYLYIQNEDQSPSDNLWFSRAAFNAAGIMEAQQAWRKAANIYERVVEADIPASRDALERMEKLRADHWLSFY